MTGTLLQAQIPAEEVNNAFSGVMGEVLDVLIEDCEAILWGGTTLGGEVFSGATGVMLGVASSLAAVFAIIMAANVAFKTIAEGERLDVLKIFRPIAVAFVLANWYAVTSGIYAIIHPLERGFRQVYLVQNSNLEAMREERDSLSRVINFAMLDLKGEAQMSEQQQQTMDKARAEAAREARREGNLAVGDEQVDNQWESYGMTAYSGTVYNQMDAYIDDDGVQKVAPETDTLVSTGYWFDWAEDVLLWIGEFIWMVAVYFVFITRYLFMYVLVMFGPLYFAASILKTWEDVWSEWLGKYVTVCLYGMTAYLTLTLCILILQAAVASDIATLQSILANEENFYSYVSMASAMSGVGTALMYLITLFVGTLLVARSFEFASVIFPGETMRGAAEFFGGAMKFVNEKEQQAEQKVKEAIAVAVTMGAAAAEVEVAQQIKEMDELMDEFTDDDDDDIPLNPVGDDAPDGDAPDAGPDKKAERKPEGWGHEGKMDYDEWRQMAAENRRVLEETARQYEKDKTLHHLSDKAEEWADRVAWQQTLRDGRGIESEDHIAEIRDRHFLEDAHRAGVGEAFEEMRRQRLRENMLLLELVKGGMDPEVRLLTLRGLFGRDKGKNADMRRLLKKHGLYGAMLKAEFFYRLAQSTKFSVYYTRGLPLFDKGGIGFYKGKRARGNYHAMELEQFNRRMDDIGRELAWRARRILAGRDINVNSRGEAVIVPGADLYWRRDISYADWFESMGGIPGDKSHVSWFMQRYGTEEEARKLLMQLDVLEAKMEAEDADDFVLRRKLEAVDAEEMQLWENMVADWNYYNRVRKWAQSVIDKAEDAPDDGKADDTEDTDE